MWSMRAPGREGPQKALVSGGTTAPVTPKTTYQNREAHLHKTRIKGMEIKSANRQTYFTLPLCVCVRVCAGGMP